MKKYDITTTKEAFQMNATSEDISFLIGPCIQRETNFGDCRSDTEIPALTSNHYAKCPSCPAFLMLPVGLA